VSLEESSSLGVFREALFPWVSLRKFSSLGVFKEGSPPWVSFKTVLGSFLRLFLATFRRVSVLNWAHSGLLLGRFLS